MKEGEDYVRIKHIQEAVFMILDFLKGVDLESFNTSDLLQSAVIRKFEIIGEASVNISQKTKDRFPNIPWSEMKSFRNLLIHEYFRIDVGEIWSSYLNDIPTLQEQIEDIISWFEKNNFHKP